MALTVIVLFFLTLAVWRAGVQAAGAADAAGNIRSLGFTEAALQVADSTVDSFVICVSILLTLTRVIFGLMPEIYLINILVNWTVMPARLDELGAALCQGVVTQTITYEPERNPFPGPYYLDTGIAKHEYRNYALWKGECSYTTGYFGINGGPYGEEFYIDFTGGGTDSLMFRHRFEYSLRENVLDIGGWLDRASLPFELKDGIKPPRFPKVYSEPGR